MSVQFDDDVESLDSARWVISANVNIGDKLRHEVSKKILNRIFNRISEGANLNGDFLYVVCSPAFKLNPDDQYKSSIDGAYVQDVFNKDDAMLHLEKMINSIGKVSLMEFTDKIHGFLETEEWDFLMQDSAEKWIFANLHEGAYHPEHLVELKSLDNLEYIDVKNHEYQVWHWPSGDIYNIVPDREVSEGDEYSTPYTTKGEIWLPILEKVNTNKAQVKEAINNLT
jgi:hypothetical protein